MFAPLDPYQRAKSISLTIAETTSIGDLIKKTKEILEEFRVLDPNYPVALDDLCTCDVWNKDVYEWYDPKDDVEKVRETDETFIYQLRPLSEVQAMEESHAGTTTGEVTLETLGIRNVARPKRYQLDVSSLTQINRSDGWTAVLQKHLRQRFQSEERIKRRADKPLQATRQLY